eukprot:gene7238-11556_t
MSIGHNLETNFLWIPQNDFSTNDSKILNSFKSFKSLNIKISLNILGNETIIPYEISEKLNLLPEDSYEIRKLNPVPPFLPYFFKKESSEWLIQEIYENLMKEYEFELEKSVEDYSISPLKPSEYKNMMKYFLDDFPITIQNSTELQNININHFLDDDDEDDEILSIDDFQNPINLIAPKICVKTENVNKNLYKGLKETSETIYLGKHFFDSIDFENPIRSIFKCNHPSKKMNFSILQTISSIESLNMLVQMNKIYMNMIKLNKMKVSKNHWEMTNVYNHFEFQKNNVFWIVDKIEIFKQNSNENYNISSFISCLIWNEKSIISKEIFNNIELTNKGEPGNKTSRGTLNFNFDKFKMLEIDFEISSNFPIVAMNYKDFLNALKQSMIGSLDEEYQNLVEKGEFMSLNEAREQHFNLVTVKLNNDIEFKWPIYHTQSEKNKNK